MVQRKDLEYTKLSPNFIGSWLLEASLCDELINYFEENQTKHIQGITSKGSLNLDIKNRTDITLSPKDLESPDNQIFKLYFENLFQCYKDYCIQWPFIKEMVRNLEIGSFNLGRYLPGQHFQAMHTERSGLSTLHRLFAFMTYLNDVEEGGSTYFNHYDLNVQPKKGTTLIWPAEWTHAHQGNPIKKGCKYIITGWLTFPIKS
tara:strand:- start:261 stop:869 length:609 start_codon:yes stop_codon:yes gene_type:complete